jgi:hypothetical protein
MHARISFEIQREEDSHERDDQPIDVHAEILVLKLCKGIALIQTSIIVPRLGHAIVDNSIEFGRNPGASS